MSSPVRHQLIYLLLEARAGDDEGSVEVVITKNTSEHVLAANLLISGALNISLRQT